MSFTIEKFEDIEVIKASVTHFHRPVFFVYAFSFGSVLIDTGFDRSKAQVLPGSIPSRQGDIEVIHAPGHSHDHKVFYVKDRGWLFSGDVFLSEHLKYVRDDEDMPITIATLQDLLKLDFEVMFDALVGPVVHGRMAIRNKLDFLMEKMAVRKVPPRQGAGHTGYNEAGVRQGRLPHGGQQRPFLKAQLHEIAARHDEISRIDLTGHSAWSIPVGTD